MLEISFQYQRWIFLELEHGYYSNPDSIQVGYEASQETQNILRSAGLLLRFTANSMYILYDQSRLNAFSRVFEREPIFRIAIWVHAQPGEFVYSSSLPLQFRNKILYFNNRGEKNKEGNVLHAKPKVAGEDLYPIFSDYQELAAKGKKLVYEIKDPLDQTVYKEDFSGMQKVYLDLSRLPESKYSLLLNGKVQTQFVLCKTRSIQRPLALVEIILSKKEVKELLKYVEEKQGLAEQHFKISFENRKTYWRYFIIQKHLKDLESPQIDTGDESIAFEGPTPTELMGGMKAFVFESTTNLELKDNTPYQFQLVRKANTKGKSFNQILKRLPVPNSQILKPEGQGEEEKVFSEIYVYI